MDLFDEAPLTPPLAPGLRHQSADQSLLHPSVGPTLISELDAIQQRLHLLSAGQPASVENLLSSIVKQIGAVTTQLQPGPELRNHQHSISSPDVGLNAFNFAPASEVNPLPTTSEVGPTTEGSSAFSFI